MILYRLKQILLIFFLFLIFFLGGIGISFSDKEINENRRAYRSQMMYGNAVPDIESKAVSYRLNNKLSELPEMEVLDKYIENLQENLDLKGISVAVSHDGDLTYAKGFGFANTESGEHIEPRHLFRIASVSKLITAVAIMKLVEEGKVRLNSNVFGSSGILKDTSLIHYIDQRYGAITVDQLLRHTGGWGENYYDPVFTPHRVSRALNVSYPPSVDHTIKYALEYTRLNYEPGQKYAYSNLGYVILGKVIEEVSGLQYEDYVKTKILNPIGIYDMHIGKSFYHEKAPNEVTYYDNDPYFEIGQPDDEGTYITTTYGGNQIEVLGAAGGWIASAPELIRLMLAIDGSNEKVDILTKASIDRMITPDKKGNSFIGWRGVDGHGTWWRTGTLSGSSALIMRQQNGINWVVLTNTSPVNRSTVHREISRTMFTALSQVQDWPTQDLFKYKQPSLDVSEKLVAEMMEN